MPLMVRIGGNMNIVVISPKVAQESAQFLAESLGADYVNPYETDKRNFTGWDIVFNYGFSRKIKSNKVFNNPENVQISRDKVACLQVLKGKCKTIDFTLSKEEASKWIEVGEIVVARAQVKGDNGKGLVYCYTQEDLNKTEAKFWTKYQDHTHEFRVNVWKGKVVSIYNKVRKNDHFKFELYRGQEEHPQLVHIAKHCYDNIGLDWMGLDLLCTNKGELHFLEANSAPILFPYTCKRLINLIKQEIK
jgi:glutathione synthase/RimK-type ligase-like ATP-grasp enzyme